MKQNSKYFLIAILGLLLAIPFHSAKASTFPLPNIDLIVKSIASHQISTGKTDSDGNFNILATEPTGFFNVYINDESANPIKVPAKNGYVKGRIVIMTEGTVSKDPESVTPTTSLKKKVIHQKKLVTPTKKPIPVNQ